MIGYLEVRYQENPDVRINVPVVVSKYARIEAFPQNPSFSPFKGKYWGVRIKPINQYILFSFFGDFGAKDSYGRPVLSAKVLVFDVDSFHLFGRDIRSVHDFLMNTRKFDEVEFKEFIKSRSAIYSYESFESMIRSVSINGLSKALCCLIDSRRLIILDDLEASLSYARALYLLMPVSTISTISFSSDCSDLMSEYVEDVVIFRDKTREKEVISYAKKKGVPVLHGGDIKKYRCKKVDKYRALIEEIARGDCWFDISWHEKYFILLKFLDLRVNKKNVTIRDIDERIRKILDISSRILRVERAWSSD